MKRSDFKQLFKTVQNAVDREAQKKDKNSQQAMLRILNEKFGWHNIGQLGLIAEGSHWAVDIENQHIEISAKYNLINIWVEEKGYIWRLDLDELHGVVEIERFQKLLALIDRASRGVE